MVDLNPIQKITKDLKTASKLLSAEEARYLVDAYYQMQENRIRAAHQVRQQSATEEPCDVLQWYFTQAEMLENEVKKALDAYSGASSLGQWARSHKGVGPVIAAGLLAHLKFSHKDGSRVLAAGSFWRFAGLDPTTKWEKKTKRPWNASLKTLCAFKLGESFVKVSGYDDAFYGKLYKAKKEDEVRRNDTGEFAEQAAAALAAKKYGKETEAYKAYSCGRLPPAHVHRRAVRWVVKMFLSHYHEVGYEMTYGEPPPKPFAFAILGHKDVVRPPNWR